MVHYVFHQNHETHKSTFPVYFYSMSLLIQKQTRQCSHQKNSTKNDSVKDHVSNYMKFVTSSTAFSTIVIDPILEDNLIQEVAFTQWKISIELLDVDFH